MATPTPPTSNNDDDDTKPADPSSPDAATAQSQGAASSGPARQGRPDWRQGTKDSVGGTSGPLGVELHVDDFGTGYSSLTYLQRFRYDSLKIDRSFVSTMSEKIDSSAIVEAIISLGAMAYPDDLRDSP